MRPELVVGLPIGFVGAQQSKLALLESDLRYITNTNHRGGSPAAAKAAALVLTGGSAPSEVELRLPSGPTVRVPILGVRYELCTRPGVSCQST